MRRHPLAPLAFVCAALTLPAAAEDAVDFKIVVPADHPVTSISRQALSEVFLLKTSSWEDGTPAAPVDQHADSELRAAFSLAIHGRSITAIENFWQRVAYSGSGSRPPAVGSDEEVLEALEGHPGAVGYVSASTPLDFRFRVLDVEGASGYDVAELAAAGRGRGGVRFAARDDVTVGRHGDVRLFLTGACGPADEGRHAVLENRNAHMRVEATIETSIWDDRWFRASSVSRHALEPVAEERLGCTLRSDGERRYAIVETSSASSHRVGATDLGDDLPGHDLPGHDRPGYDRPARDAIAIVAAGTCGSGHRGERRAVINRHPFREIAVQVETREIVDGTARRRYQKRYRLAPGGTRHLGCGADGKTVREFALLEAEYR